jgi:hypothetical protein
MEMTGSGNASRHHSQASAPNHPEDKSLLEVEKLEAELREIQAKTAELTSLRVKFKGWINILVIVVALLSGGWGLYEASNKFFDQRERELEFNVSKEMILLSTQLGSANPTERANAALLLAEFEEHSVPILISNLRVTDKPHLSDHLIESLKLIMKKERVKKHPEKVLDPLLKQSVLIFDEEILKTSPSIEAMANYLDALSEVAAGSQNGKIVSSLKALKSKINSLDSPFGAIQKDGLITRIDETIKSISNL